jgi:hypothetical protein
MFAYALLGWPARLMGTEAGSWMGNLGRGIPHRFCWGIPAP